MHHIVVNFINEDVHSCLSLWTVESNLRNARINQRHLNYLMIACYLTAELVVSFEKNHLKNPVLSVMVVTVNNALLNIELSIALN